MSILHLDPVLASTPAARDWLAAELQGVPSKVTESAALLISEVVTNAVLHARTEIWILLDVGPNLIRVEVADRNPVFLFISGQQAPHAETGRGLTVVAAVSSNWGVRKTPKGKVVWFELPCT